MKKIPLVTILLSQACLSMENPELPELFESKDVSREKTDSSICYGGPPTPEMVNDIFEIERNLNTLSVNKMIEDKSIEMTKKLIHNLNIKKSNTQNCYNKLTDLYLSIEDFSKKYFSEDQNDIEKIKTNFDLAKKKLYIRVFKIYAICSENSLGQLLKDDFYLFQQQVIKKDSAFYDMDAISSVLKHLVSNQFSVTNRFIDKISAFDDEISSLEKSIGITQQIPLDPTSQPQPLKLSSENRNELPSGSYRDRFTGEIKFYPTQSPIGKRDSNFSMKYLESRRNSPYNFNSTNTMTRLDSPYALNRQNTNSTLNHSKITTEPSAEAKKLIEHYLHEIEVMKNRRRKTENQYYQLPEFYFEIERVLNYLQNNKDNISDVKAIFNLSKNMIYDNLLNIHDICEENDMDEILMKELYFFREQIIIEKTMVFDINIISEVLKQILSNKSTLIEVFTNKISEIEKHIFSLHHEITKLDKNKTNSSFSTTLEIMEDTPSPELYSGETSFSGSDPESEIGKSFVSTRIKSNTNSKIQLLNPHSSKTLTQLRNENNSENVFPRFENLRRTNSPLKTTNETNDSTKHPNFSAAKGLALSQSRSPEDLVFLLLESVPEEMHIGDYAETLSSDSYVYKEFYKSFSLQLACFNDFNVDLWMNLPQHEAVQSLGLRSSFFLPGFIQAIKENKTIKTLDITNAILTEVDEKCIADILEANKGIELVGNFKKVSYIPSDIISDTSVISKKSIRKSEEKIGIKDKTEIETDDSLRDIEKSYADGQLDEATYWLLKNEMSKIDKF